MYNPLLMLDFYKCVHSEQYPTTPDGAPRMSKIYSPYTPRLSRLDDVDKVVYFGGQAFCKEYLIKYFNEYFFNRPLDEVIKEYDRILTYTLGKGVYNSEKIAALHKLGYLPIAVYTVPEGTRTAIGVPQSVFVNTHPDFAWLTNALETAYSSYMWHIQVSAEVGYRYRQIVEKYTKISCDDNVRAARQLGDFSMRGQHSPESAMKSSAGWLLSFLNTATVPAIMWLEDYYNCNVEKEEVGFGAISTEHSVMCSNYALDGDEITHIKRLLTKIYPNANFSMVSDSYDFWNLVVNILPQCKVEIEEHNGYLAIRGDSGNPVEIMAGKEIERVLWYYGEDAENLFINTDYTYRLLKEYAWNNEIKEYKVVYFDFDNKFYEVVIDPIYNDYDFVDGYEISWEEVERTPEIMGLVWTLDQIFGSTINSKGYKVLPFYIRGIYGDSITPQGAEEIYKRLTNQGYAINNVVLGVGSFSFMCLAQDGNMKPYTRDTFGVAIKATYGETIDGKSVMIFKNPKGATWKRSQKGCCIVAADGQSYTDEHTFAEAHGEGVENLLQMVFCDSEMINETTLAEVRSRLYPEGF